MFEIYVQGTHLFITNTSSGVTYDAPLFHVRMVKLNDDRYAFQYPSGRSLTKVSFIAFDDLVAKDGDFTNQSTFEEWIYALIGSTTEGQDIIVDAAGRREVSQVHSLGDYVLARDNLPLYFDQEVGGTGAQSYDAATNSQSMTVAADTDFSIFQTKQGHPYFPGHAHQPEFTYINLAPETDVIKRVGYFSSNIVTPFNSDKDGIYLESSSGTVKFVIEKTGTRSVTEQAVWTSGTDIDWSKFQVSLEDFLYLGGTSVSLYQIYRGVKRLLTRHDHANVFPDTILGHPSQPIRAEIRSTGGSGSFNFSCANVGTLGSITPTFGTPVSVDTGASLLTLSTDEEAVLGLRKNDPTIEFFPGAVDISANGASTAIYRWWLSINPVLSAPLSYTAIPNTFIDGAMGTGQIVTTRGHVIATGSGVARSDSAGEIPHALRVGREIAGDYDELVLSVDRLAGAQSITASMDGTVI